MATTEQFRALGSIDAYESVQIVSEVNALVVRLPFVEGAPIEAGALIAQLDNGAAAAEAARTEAQQTLARSNAERAEKLFAGASISQSQRDDAHAALQVAEANAAAAKVQLDGTIPGLLAADQTLGGYATFNGVDFARYNAASSSWNMKCRSSGSRSFTSSSRSRAMAAAGSNGTVASHRRS